MSDRNRLILHIGTNKTGTTSLQTLMTLEREALAERGICYPTSDRPPFPHRRKHLNLWKAMKAGPEAFYRERDALLTEFDSSGADTLLMSEEHLSNAGLKIDDALSDLTDYFDIEAVCFLSRQDRYLESWWSERCKSGRETLNIDDFVVSDKARARINYLSLLDYWATYARVTAIGFEQACTIGLTRSLNEATGLDLPPETRKRNVSPDMRTAAIMAALNRHGVAANWREIEASLSGPRQRHALGARLRAEILAQCAEQNAELAERYGVVFPEEMPDEPPQPIKVPTPEDLEAFLGMESAPSGKRGRRARARAARDHEE